MKIRKPRIDPPASHPLGVTNGTWWIAMVLIGIIVVGVLVVLVLVGSGDLPKAWAYACLPVGILCAAVARVLTIFKGGAEDKRP